MSQITLLTTEGQVFRAWIGLSGSARQRRLHVRRFKRAGYSVRFNPK